MSTTPEPQLFIPTKNAAGAQNRNITIALRAIERWGNTLVQGGGGGGGGYASLTGPGQTTTPGQLTQAGGFFVTDFGLSGTSGDGINLQTYTSTSFQFIQHGAGGISITNYGNGGLTITDQGSGGANLNSTGTGGVGASSTSGIFLTDNSPGAGIEIVENNTGGQILLQGHGGVNIEDTSASGILIQEGGAGGIAIQSTSTTVAIQANTSLSLTSASLILSGLPTTNPGVANHVWRNGTVLNIV